MDYLGRLAPRLRVVARQSVCGGAGPSSGVRWMSVRPEDTRSQRTARKKMTIQRLQQLRQNSTPITMLTAYDFPSARRCEASDVDICLVGDSLAQVALGYDSTTRLTLDEMVHHCRAVSRGAKTPLLVADMPFGTYQLGKRDAMEAAVRIVREGGMEAVKIEGHEEVLDTVRYLTRNGIAVMGHIGLLPQRHASLSGYKVQGRTAQEALEIMSAAIGLQDAGAFSLVLEAVPARLAERITSHLDIPTIGIGAGLGCSGQVLVQDDALGVWAGHKAKFVRRFADVGSEAQKGVDGYAKAVREGAFPAEAEWYDMSDDDFATFETVFNQEVKLPRST